MAGTLMYGNLSNEESASQISLNSGSLEKSPVKVDWTKLPKMNTNCTNQMEAGMMMTKGSTHSHPSAFGIHQVMKSDQVAKIGLMRIKVAHAVAGQTVTGQRTRPGSAMGVSVTRELAFGNSTQRQASSDETSLEGQFMAKIPDGPCLGRIGLIATVFILVVFIYFLNLKQYGLEKQLREKWEEENPILYTKLILNRTAIS